MANELMHVCRHCEQPFSRVEESGRKPVFCSRTCFENSQRAGAAQSFERQVRINGECVEWTGYVNALGYGRVRFNGRKWLTHRLAWVRAFGAIPDGFLVLHRCDNPPCVNPAHLFLGTHADNVADMIAKGRQVHPRGSDHPMAKLTECDVVAVRTRLKGGESRAAIAASLGVSTSLVGYIEKEKIWTHVT